MKQIHIPPVIHGIPTACMSHHGEMLKVLEKYFETIWERNYLKKAQRIAGRVPERFMASNSWFDSSSFDVTQFLRQLSEVDSAESFSSTNSSIISSNFLFFSHLQM